MGHSEVDREIEFINRRRLTVQKAFGEVQEVNSFEGEWNSKQSNTEQWTRLIVNFDTGAAVTAVPLELQRSGLLSGDGRPNSSSYKTASGELLEDGGGTVVRGFDNNGVGKSVEGRLIDVHRMLASGTAVSKKNVVMLMGGKGVIVPKDNRIALGLQAAYEDLVKRYPGEAQQTTHLYEQKGIFVFDLWLKPDGTAVGSEGHFGQSLGAVGEGFPRQGNRNP